MPLKFLPLFSVLLMGKLAFSQHYHHNVFSFRLAFADTINSKINVELSLQKRTQGTSSNQDNLFKSNQVKSTWLWVNFDLSERSTISLSPFGYYQNFVLNAKPNDEYLPPVKEYRWSVRFVNEQKGRIVNYTNRYTAEYRLRDIHHNNIYTSSYRMRYMAKLEKPLYHLFSHTRSVKLELYDELFLQMGHAVYNKPNIFDQNRVYLGFNYELFRNFKTSIGYVYGIQERSSGEEFDNMNMLWVVLTFENVFTQFRHKKI